MVTSPGISVALILAVAGSLVEVQGVSGAEPAALVIHTVPGAPWIRLSAPSQSNVLYSLESSLDFHDWKSLATTHDAIQAYPDASWTNVAHRFYRLSFQPRTSNDDWKNQVWFPDDKMRSPEYGVSLDEIRWLKFAILLDDPYRIYYQDSRKYLFHYDFATERLPSFLGLSPAEFDHISLHATNQQVLLGTLLYPPPPNASEYGIQFVGLDPYPPEMVRYYFDLVKATVAAPPGVRAFYVPTFEQNAVVRTNLDYFNAHDIGVTSSARWLSGNQCYAPGWAMGRLTFISGDEIVAAYADGRLLPSDILLTDMVPSEIPFLAGVIALNPSTPNSHVAILARSFGIPFVYVPDAIEQDRIQSLTGRRVALRVRDLFDGCEVRLIDVEEELTPELETEILGLKQPPELNFMPKSRRGALSVSTESLTPADVGFVGGKAANYGFLRREIPQNSDVAIALTFDLWDDFMAQTLPGGKSLGSSISNLLAGYHYPADVANLRRDLEGVRDMIEFASSFTPEQEQAIIEALGIFDPARKIRFRSSTNVEDTEQFTGAGLYDSYSGCLLDDLDDDATGPSQCDPEEVNERGVFRAIKKVYASFYNENAVLERLRLRVDESQVGMAVLVHHSYPDEIELANGVATLEVNGGGSSERIFGDMVTQKGAVPVTNPEGNALPEVIDASRYSFGTFFNLRQRSSLVPLGGYVLDWDSEYRAFMELFIRVANGYALAFPSKPGFVLDFEYKKIEPDWLVVKQVRALPSLAQTNVILPFLLGESNRFGVFLGEFGDVFANHRLKSFWHFKTHSLRLYETNLAQTIYKSADHQFVEDGLLENLQGSPGDWDLATHTVDGEMLSDGWTTGSGEARRRFTLVTHLRRGVTGEEPPLFTQRDYAVELSARYDTPQPALDYMGNPMTVTEEVVRLMPCPQRTPTSLRQERAFTNGTVVIRTSFYWPEPPRGFDAGYTAPLVEWEQTVITGLASEPITLQGDFSQTYRPGHHNFTEDFIFEPRLELGLEGELLLELTANNIQLIHVVWGQLNAPMKVLGLDGEFRDLKP